MFLEKCNFDNKIEIYSGYSYNVDSDVEYFGDSDKKIPMKKFEINKIQLNKIKCINLFFRKKK